MRTQLDLDEFIPTMDTPEKVYQLFDSLGYKVLDSRLKTNPSVYNLPVKEAALVEKIFAVSNYDRRFQILLFKLKADGPEQSRREAIRTIPEKILREVDFPFIIFTPDFKTYTFTLVEKVREGPGEFKRKLTKLVVDSTQPYHTDKEILTSLTLSTDTKNPVEVYKLFQSAFSVEKVTKKFFTEYREVFERLVKEVTKQNKHLKFTLFSRDGSVENFVKILLGRLMFLYFIQKRGWLNCFDGWGSGDKKFLYNKFQEAEKDKKNYYKDYLEPLFFDTLNNPRRDKPDQATQFGGRIPFLNGGLFEPEYDYQDVRNYILLENSTFDDVFSVFEKYNFTVKEDEPLEKEVAIDPEMLGKVFENLLEENLRKGKGTYYTPREIVHYMCHESLINYLSSEVGIEQEEIRNFLDREQSLEKKETLSPLIKGKAKEIDEKLADIKVLDPACGSGAFLVGMLHEVINARLSLNRELGRSLSEYELKKATIQNNIYGVDIDPGASEIAKLRLWLTLVVDHNLPEIEPLPNLDYKIMVGNSLIELLSPTLLSKSPDQERNKLIDDLNESKKAYATAYDMNRKGELREKINSLVQVLANYDQQKEKDRIWHQLLGYQGQTKIFEDAPVQSSFGDIEKKLSKKLDELDKLKDVTVTDHFEWHLNFNEVFERGGFDVVIANPPYDVLNKTEGHKITERELNELRHNPLYKDALGGKVNLFRLFIARGINLLKDDGIMNMIMPYAFMGDRTSLGIRDYCLDKTQIIFIEAFPERDDKNVRVFESVKMSTCILCLQKISPNKPFRVRTHYARQILDSVPTYWIDKDEVYFLDPASHSIPMIDENELCILKKIVDPNKSILLSSIGRCYEGEINLTFHRKFLTKDKSNTPMIKGAQIDRYRIKKVMSQGEIEYLKESEYLKQNKGDKSQHHLHERIVMQGITGVNERVRLKMMILKQGTYCGNSANYILINDNKYSNKTLLAILNSFLLNWYFKKFSTNSNVNGYEVDVLPIPKKLVGAQDKLGQLADSLLTSEGQNKETEEELDQLVYKLYGLTPEEIKIVEETI